MIVYKNSFEKAIHKNLNRNEINEYFVEFRKR